MDKSAKIYVAGHRGLVGSALMRRLISPSPSVGEGRGEGKGPYTHIITRTHAPGRMPKCGERRDAQEPPELDLTDQRAVQELFEKEQPEYVFLAAAKVGGIHANNTYPGDFIYQNLAIQTNVIHESWRAGVKRLLFLGSSCIYPRDCPQPMKEEYLLTGTLEPTNRPYAIAKIAGIEMCWSYNRQYGTQYLAVMPTNLYGPNDNYDLQNSHVLPALIKKMHEAKIKDDKEVVVWGTGTPRREFLYSDDMADACVFLMNLPSEEFAPLLAHYSSPPLINIGCGKDITIRELADIIRGIVGFKGEIIMDISKPDGPSQKLLDVGRLNTLGWRAVTEIKQGITMAYNNFLAQ